MNNDTTTVGLQEGTPGNIYGTTPGVGPEDLVVIVVYFVLCLAVGLCAAWQTKRTSISGYFLAGREMKWFTIGASIFSTDFGTGAVLGMAGTGAASGIAVASYELNAIPCVILLGWLFVPVYIASGVYTLPEYLKKRFGGQRLQIYMAVLTLILCIFIKLSSDIYAGAVFIKQSTGWNMYLGVAVLLSITAIYTIIGGLKAVIYTDTLQTVVLMVGCVILTILSFIKVGGMQSLYAKYMEAIPSTQIYNNASCGTPNSEAFHLFRDAFAGDLPWPGNLFGITILSAWYFCSDQVMVQRSLAAKNMHHVKGGSIFASYLKLLPLFIIIFPGMISRVLFTDEVACVDQVICESVCGNPAGCTNIAYPKLIMELMPPGLKGVMLAAMLAFLMSSLTSVFNSSSTILTIDIWTKLRKHASDGELLVVGRLFVLVMVAITILWLPVLQTTQGGQLFNYMQSMTGYLTPPVLAVYVSAISSERTNEPGAFWGLMVGLIVGVTRMGLDFYYGEPACGEQDLRPSVVARVHFLHFTILLFIISVVTTMIVSLMTQKIDPKHLTRLTWWTRHSIQVRIPFEDEVFRDDITHTSVEERQDNALEANDEDPSKNPKGSAYWKRAVYFICGYDSMDKAKAKQTMEQLQEQMVKFTNIQQEPKWSRFLNVNAVVIIAIAATLWGYYA